MYMYPHSVTFVNFINRGNSLKTSSHHHNRHYKEQVGDTALFREPDVGLLKNSCSGQNFPFKGRGTILIYTTQEIPKMQLLIVD